MLYNRNGDYVPLMAEKITDILGQKEIGGVRQLIYYPFRYKDLMMKTNIRNLPKKALISQ